MARMVHRRVGPPADTDAQTWQGGKMKQIDDQLEADREMMEKLRDAVSYLHSQNPQLTTRINHLYKVNEDTGKNMIDMEKGIMQRVDGNKLAGIKDTDDKVSDLKDRMKFEFSNPECFTAHLMGAKPQEKPVVKPLIELYTQERFNNISELLRF